MVTSSAVVGSSAISSLGLQAIAMAIITRWFMPPESWCGKAFSRVSGAGMPTWSSSSMARARRAARPMLVWSCSTSVSWKPTVKQGLRLDIGSWKIIDISAPMIARRWRGVSASRSWPAKRKRSARDGSGRRQKAHHRQHGHRFAGAGLPDDRQHLARHRRSATRCPRRGNADGGREFDGQIFDLQQRHRVRTSSAWDRARRAGRRPSD